MNSFSHLQTGGLRALLRDWLRLEPIRHAAWEMVVMRLSFAMLVWDVHTGWINYWRHPWQALLQMTIPSRWNDVPYASQPHPNGLGMWMDFSFLADNAFEPWLLLAAGVSLLLYVFGVPAAFSLAVPLLAGVGAATLINSQGAIGHIAQGLHLCLLVVWLAGVWSLVCKKRGRPLPCDFNAGQLEMDWARQGLAASYVVSAITKLIESQGRWFIEARYFPLGLVKNNDMQFYDTLDASARQMDWLPQLLMEHPLLCQFFFGIALPLELFVFLGLRNRRMAALFGIGLIVFHECVTQLTHLSFIFNKLLLLILFVNLPWWIGRWSKLPACSQKN